MSIHKSLKRGNALSRPRNVLKRHERIQALTKIGRITEDASVFNLPKTKGEFKMKKIKVKKKGPEGEEAAAAGAAAPAAK
ncbi:MAG: small basic protein [Planctomycetes bacterium]|nr:small basic protein [Planctomycetota bacterium]